MAGEEHSDKRGVKIARLWSTAFRFITGHISECTILLTDWAGFRNFPFGILMNQVSTTIALPPDSVFHASLLKRLAAMNEGWIPYRRFN